MVVLMKVLFIGGTGNISTRVSQLAIDRGIDLFHLNRGKTRKRLTGVRDIVADIHDEAGASAALAGHEWDCVVDWIAFTPGHVQRDIRLFQGKVRQFIFISSASAYQKPLAHPVVTEATALCNPYWQYSRDKIACENLLMEAYRNDGFPSVIVRPSHTYDTIWPFAVGPSSDFTMADRMKRGLPILVHGDGTSVWTLTHSADFAKAFVGLIGNPQALGGAYHITGDERLTWDQIHDIIARAVGGEAKPVHVPSRVLEATGWGHGGLIGDKAWSPVFDNSKIRGIVSDFHATIPFHVGVHDIVEHYSEPSRQKIDAGVNERMDAFIRKWQDAVGTVEAGIS